MVLRRGKVSPSNILKNKHKSGFIKNFGEVNEKHFMASRILCSFNTDWSKYYYTFENKNKKLIDMSGGDSDDDGDGDIEEGNGNEEEGNVDTPSFKKSQKIFINRSKYIPPPTTRQQAIDQLEKLQKGTI